MLVPNANGADQTSAIFELIFGANAIAIAVVFFKKDGADHIAPLLEEQLAASTTGELFVGTTPSSLSPPRSSDCSNLAKAKADHR